MESLLKSKNKRGQLSGGLVTGIIFGIAGLVIGTIIAFVIINSISGANLLTANSAQANATTLMIGNFTEGVNNVSAKLPTVLLIGAVVLILAVLGFLVAIWQKMRMGGGAI